MVYILGGWQSDFKRNWAREGLEIVDGFAEALRGGLDAVDMAPDEIEVGHVGNFVGDLFAGQGLLGGFFLVPMNALLQHRGHVLMSAGHSIAVQNFNENLSILPMLAMYSLMLRAHLNLDIIILLFGLFLAGTMLYIMRRHQANQREFDSISLIGEAKH